MKNSKGIIFNTEQFDYFEPIIGLKAKLVHTENQTFAFWEIAKDTILPEHKHLHKQISIVTKGQLELTIDGKTTLMKKGAFRGKVCYELIDHNRIDYERISTNF